jgi:hypothetical protein
MKYKYTLVFLQFFRKHKDGKSSPSMENRRDIPIKSKNKGVGESKWITKKAPRSSGRFQRIKIEA